MRSLNRFKLIVVSTLAAGMLAAIGGNAVSQPPAEEHDAPPAQQAQRAPQQSPERHSQLDDGPDFLRDAESVFDGLLLELAPKPLLKRGPYHVLWAQWLGLPIIILAAWLLGIGLNYLSRAIARPLARRTTTPWDDAVVERLSAPFTFGWTLIMLFFLLQLLGLRPVPLAFAFKVLRAGWLLGMFWALGRVVDVGSRVLAVSTFGPNVSARRALLPLAVRVSKLLVIVFAIVALLAQLGYSVASIVAGLGVGGLAVALAAQKTFEHWFGAFAIAVDQPFREGDFIRVDNLSGSVEQIGIRTTRIRTLDRTIVSIPNGKLAEMQTESFAPRDRTRLSIELRLIYGTTSAQVREVLEGIERALREEEKVREESISVILRELAHASLVVEVIAFFDTTDVNEFNVLRQNLLLTFMEIIETAGTQLALPAQRIEVASADRTIAVEHEHDSDTKRSASGVVSAPGSSRRQ
jgi:MscS family membrane protein